MTFFMLQTFGGRAPKASARLLPNDMATVATNSRLDSGRLESWANNLSASITPVASYSVSGSTKTLFKYNNSVWIGSNEELDIFRSPVAEDTHNRIYVTGIGGATGYPRMSTATIVGSGTYYRLGIPRPATFDAVPTLNPSTSANVDSETATSRAYTFTYVSAYGEESQPMIASTSDVVDWRSDQTVALNFPSNPSGAYNLTIKRVYRTDSNGTFRRVADVSIANDTYTDNVAELSLGEALATSDFASPPDDNSTDHPDGAMQGLVSMPNGIFAGFVGQTVLFSEPFQPHAWPVGARLTMKSDVVALAPLNNGLLVLTKEKPAVIQGDSPQSMQMREIDSTLSCTNKRSVVDMGEYVLYASPDGLVMANDSGIRLVTEPVFTREQWQTYNPETVTGYYYEGHYVGFYQGDSGNAGFIFDPRGGKDSYVDLNFYATAGYNDLENDELYMVVSGSVVKFALGAGKLGYTWRTKKFHIPRSINPAVAKLDCESYSPNPTFKLYADGVLKHTETVTDSSLFRLPSGYKANEFEVEIAGQVPVNQVCVYESAGEISA